MSDGGIWQPPDPGTSTPVAEPTAKRGRSRAAIIGAIVGAVAIVGAGTFAVARIAGDDSAGGADTPEDAGTAFIEALGNEDVLGVVDVLLPGERQAFRAPLDDLVAELQRLEVLSEDADLAAVQGVDFTFEDVSVDAEATNVADIVNVSIDATVTGSVVGDELPVGQWLRDELGEELAELDETDTSEGDELNIIAVEQDGRWYLSLLHTIAETARRDSGEGSVPEEGIEPAGSDSPEAAMDALLDAVEELDVEGMIAALDPGEAQALQRYAPLFLDSAEAEVATVPFDVSITDRAYTVDGSGDTRSMAVDAVAVELADGEQTVSMELSDGCWTVEAPDIEPTESCGAVGDFQALADLFEDTEAQDTAEEFLSAVQDAFSDYDNPGFVVRQVDGEWYVSPIASWTEQLLAIARALTREEIEDLQARGTELFEVFAELEAEAAAPIDDQGVVPVDPADECWTESDATTAASCFEALVDDGVITPADIPWYVRFPECGLAELGWNGDYSMLPDAEFVDAVDAAAPCFQALVESGEADAFDLPPELLSPQCLDGRNWYQSTDSTYLKEFEDCAFG